MSSSHICRYVSRLKSRLYRLLTIVIITSQGALKPNPTRAAELRAIEKSTEGWLHKVWSNLAMIRVTCSGPYAAIVPKVTLNIPFLFCFFL